MSKQMYIRRQSHDAKKIQDYSSTIIPEVKMRGRWYSVPLDAEVVEFDPKTLTLTTILPIRGPK